MQRGGRACACLAGCVSGKGGLVSGVLLEGCEDKSNYCARLTLAMHTCLVCTPSSQGNADKTPPRHEFLKIGW